MKLTPQQKDALTSGEPVPLREPETRLDCVLVRADAFERLKQLRDREDVDPCAAYPAIDEAWKEGWDDPKMNDYDHYEERCR